MNDDHLTRLRDARKWLNDGQCCGQVDSAGICAAPACIFGEALKEFDKAAAEITRLRAACDAYFKTISLSQMRHGRILVGLERRNARQRRVLAKLYQRRHDKNVALATARREGMEEAAQKALIIASALSSPSAQNALRSFADAISAAAKEGE